MEATVAELLGTGILFELLSGLEGGIGFRVSLSIGTAGCGILKLVEGEAV